MSAVERAASSVGSLFSASQMRDGRAEWPVARRMRRLQSLRSPTCEGATRGEL